MWLFFLMWATIAAAEQYSEADIHELELSTFYADCAVFDDPNLFGGQVCCSDGRTYSNCVHMACLNHWRQPNDRVKMVSKGPCETCSPSFPWSPIYSPVCGTDGVTYANIEALLLHNDKDSADILVQYEGECDGSCTSCDDTTSCWGSAVCASNGRTYPGVGAIADMRRFGQCLDVLHDGGCTVEEVKERVKGRAELCDIARNFYEFNPVCGEDNVTYPTPAIMLCFRPHIKSQYMGKCDSTLHQACVQTIAIENGEAESDGQVCGSDGLTYSSLHHLVCATSNDRHLYVLHTEACTAVDNPCTRMPEVADKGTPVCGSDGVTYINSYALWCMQRKEDPFLRYFHDGVCFRRCVECTCGV